MSVLRVGVARPSNLCGGCTLYGEKCHCLCHVENLVSGYHEILWQMLASPIVHPEDNDPSP